MPVRRHRALHRRDHVGARGQSHRAVLEQRRRGSRGFEGHDEGQVQRPARARRVEPKIRGDRRAGLDRLPRVRRVDQTVQTRGRRRDGNVRAPSRRSAGLGRRLIHSELSQSVRERSVRGEISGGGARRPAAAVEQLAKRRIIRGYTDAAAGKTYPHASRDGTSRRWRLVAHAESAQDARAARATAGNAVDRYDDFGHSVDDGKRKPFFSGHVADPLPGLRRASRPRRAHVEGGVPADDVRERPRDADDSHLPGLRRDADQPDRLGLLGRQRDGHRRRRHR